MPYYLRLLFSLADDLQEVEDILRREQYILRYYDSSGQNIKQKNAQSVNTDEHTKDIPEYYLKSIVKQNHTSPYDNYTFFQ